MMSFWHSQHVLLWVLGFKLLLSLSVPDEFLLSPDGSTYLVKKEKYDDIEYWNY